MSEWFNAKCNRKVRTGFKRPITGRTPTRIRGPQFKPRTTRSTSSCYNFGSRRSCTRTQTPLQTFCLKSAAFKHKSGGDCTHIVSNSHAFLFTRTRGWHWCVFASASPGLQTRRKPPPTFSATTSPQSVLPVLPTTCCHQRRCVIGNFHFRFERGPLRAPTNHYPALQHPYRGLQSSGSHMQESFAQTCPCPYHDHEFEAAWHFVTSLWPLVTT